MTRDRVRTGSPELDGLLDGGLEPGSITQFYGEPATGKSTFCVLAAVAVLRSGRFVAYIDTEGFSIERFRQIAGDDAEQLAERLFLYEPTDFDSQGVMIAGSEKVLSGHDTGLFIVDSATLLYRTQLEKGRDAMQKLIKQMVYLLGLAKRHNIPAIITNQVYVDTVRGTYMPLGGTALGHISKTIVRIDRLDGLRRAVLVKHRSRPSGLSFEFEIVKEGIRAVNTADSNEER
jgi:DNA repair protein RadB